MGWCKCTPCNCLSSVVDISSNVVDAFTTAAGQVGDVVTDAYHQTENTIKTAIQQAQEEYDRLEEAITETIQDIGVEITTWDTGIPIIDGMFDFTGGSIAGAFGYGCDDGESIYDKPLPAVTQDYMDKARKLEELLGIKRDLSIADMYFYVFNTVSDTYKAKLLNGTRVVLYERSYTTTDEGASYDTEDTLDTDRVALFDRHLKYFDIKEVIYFNGADSVKSHNHADATIVCPEVSEGTSYVKYSMSATMFHSPDVKGIIPQLKSTLGIVLSDFENIEYGGTVAKALFHLGFKVSNHKLDAEEEEGYPVIMDYKFNADKKMQKIADKYFAKEDVMTTSGGDGDSPATSTWTGVTVYSLKEGTKFTDLSRLDFLYIVQNMAAFTFVLVDPRGDEGEYIKIGLLILAVVAILKDPTLQTSTKLFLLAMTFASYANAIKDRKVMMVLQLIGVYLSWQNMAQNAANRSMQLTATQLFTLGMQGLGIMIHTYTNEQLDRMQNNINSLQDEYEKQQEMLEDLYNPNEILYSWAYDDQYSELYDYDGLFYK